MVHENRQESQTIRMEIQKIMIEIRKSKNSRDINGILALQKINIKSPENQGQKWSDGFVTLRHSPDLLRSMMKESPQMVAISEGEVVGYNLSLLPHMTTLFPLLEPMMAAFEEIHIDGQKLTEYLYLIGGQCCIRKDFRGKGILKMLYHGTKDELEDTCDFCVTEIAKSNPRSLKAHMKIGFEHVHSYATADHIWDIVLWDWRVLP